MQTSTQPRITTALRHNAIYNRRQLHSALLGAIDGVLLQAAPSYGHLYHDIPNELLIVAEKEEYVNLTQQDREALQRKQ